MSTAGVAESSQRDFTIWRSPNPAAGGELHFVPLAERLPGGSVQLDDGFEVDATDWPATLVADLPDGSYCTASIVGPRALLTAAHCVDLGKEPGAPGPLAGGGTVTLGGRKYTLSCEMEPAYAAAPRSALRRSSDYALCALSATVPVSVLRPESISTTALSVDSQILMAGYGCTDIVIRTVNGKEELTYTRGDGRLRMGDESVSFIGDRAASEDPGVYATTQSDGSEPTLCPGDSGGPVFQGATLMTQQLSRRVVGVNSAVAWAKRPGGVYRFYSLLAPLGTSEFKTFLTDFVQRQSGSGRNDTFIVCGFNRDPGIGGCRG